MSKTSAPRSQTEQIIFFPFLLFLLFFSSKISIQPPAKPIPHSIHKFHWRISIFKNFVLKAEFIFHLQKSAINTREIKNELHKICGIRCNELNALASRNVERRKSSLVIEDGWWRWSKEIRKWGEWREKETIAMWNKCVVREQNMANKKTILSTYICILCLNYI